MKTVRGVSSRCLKIGLIGMLAALVVKPQTATTMPFSANDVSWLFPPPTRAEDFAKLIAVRDLTSQNRLDPTKRELTWSIAAFQRFVTIAGSPEAQVDGTQMRIGIPVEAQSIDAWFIAAVRIDAGAPGLSDEINSQFGRLPQIRLIVQPVTRNPDGTPKVLDIAGHLIFNFTLGLDASSQVGCPQRPTPDLVAFQGIVSQLDTLRSKLSTGLLGTNKVSTAGVPLGIHPGLADATTAYKVRQEMKDFLDRNLSDQRLVAMAIVGVPSAAPAPWIFLSMQRVPDGGFFPVPGPTLNGQQVAEMFNPGGDQVVTPAPQTNNLNSITCKNAAISSTSLPAADRKGSSTAELFVRPAPPSDRTREILDLIVDPKRSHFFNTDCVSCHTETRRAITLLQLNIPGIDPAVLPRADYTVRNFGWAPPIDGVQAVVTRRTAAETAAVVEFINSQLLKK